MGTSPPGTSNPGPGFILGGKKALIGSTPGKTLDQIAKGGSRVVLAGAIPLPLSVPVSGFSTAPSGESTTPEGTIPLPLSSEYKGSTKLALPLYNGLLVKDACFLA